MKKVTRIALILILGISAMAVSVDQAQASDILFWLNAWNQEQLPSYVGAPGARFLIQFFDEAEDWVGEIEMEDSSPGGLYWVYIDEIDFGQNGEYPGAVTWTVEFFPDLNWDLGDEPDNAWQWQGEINFFDDNVANPENWFLVPLVRR